MWDKFTCRIILNGIVVKVGCQRIFFPTPAALCDALNDYINDPQALVKRLKDTPFRKITESEVVAEERVSSVTDHPPSSALDEQNAPEIKRWLVLPTWADGMFKNPSNFCDGSTAINNDTTGPHVAR